MPQPQRAPGAKAACCLCGKALKAVSIASLGRRRPRDSLCIRSWAHFSVPRSSPCLHGEDERNPGPNRKAGPGFYARVGARGLGKRPQEVLGPKAQGRRYQRVQELCSWTPCIRRWDGACSGPGSRPGKAWNTEQPSRLRLRGKGSRSPSHPAYWREQQARYVPAVDRL